MRFNIQKTFALLITIIFAIPAFAIDDAIIPQASYMIYDQTNSFGLPDALSKEITFYTFDGNPIVTTEHHFVSRAELLKKLDPYAPKPQPVSYEITQPKSVWNPLLRVLDVQPNCFIIFYDKNGNVIKRYQYNKKQHEIVVYSSLPTKDPRLAIAGVYHATTVNDLRKLTDFPLDLSRVTEKPKHSKKLK